MAKFGNVSSSLHNRPPSPASLGFRLHLNVSKVQKRRQINVVAYESTLCITLFGFKVAAYSNMIETLDGQDNHPCFSFLTPS
jgi:hypothetical protein